MFVKSKKFFFMKLIISQLFGLLFIASAYAESFNLEKASSMGRDAHYNYFMQFVAAKKIVGNVSEEELRKVSDFLHSQAQLIFNLSIQQEIRSKLKQAEDATGIAYIFDEVVNTKERYPVQAMQLRVFQLMLSQVMCALVNDGAKFNFVQLKPSLPDVSQHLGIIVNASNRFMLIELNPNEYPAPPAFKALLQEQASVTTCDSEEDEKKQD